MIPAPPYQLVTNDHTWLDLTYMVFIDPVGTGYSRAARPELAAKFLSLNGDLDSVGEFIRMYLTRHAAWASPLFLVGESYGTTRASGDDPEFDPSMTAIRPPYTATFNDYVRRELGYKSDAVYHILGGGFTSPWSMNADNAYADTSLPLRSALAKNPFMKLFVAYGYYDMATPYFAAEYTIDHLNLDPRV